MLGVSKPVDGSASDHPEDGWIDEDAGDIELQQSPSALHPQPDSLRPDAGRPVSVASGNSEVHSLLLAAFLFRCSHELIVCAERPKKLQTF